MLTEQNKINLDKLATYLESLPKDYGRFNMNHYCMISDYSDEKFESYVFCETEHFCGTVACAVGHGPAAGVCMTEAQARYEDWNDYSVQFTNDPELDNGTYAWLFAGSWAYTDNTPHGAAARIRFLLDGNEPPLVAKQLAVIGMYRPYRGEHKLVPELQAVKDRLVKEVTDLYRNYIKE